MKNSIVKCYDADIFTEMLDIIHLYCSKLFKIYNLINFTQRNSNIVFTNQSSALNECISLLNQGYNIAIASTSKEYSNTLANVLHSTNAKIVKITSDGAISTIPEEISIEPKQLKEELSSNTDNWTRYNCVIYTPTITTGISYNETNHFYKNS